MFTKIPVNDKGMFFKFYDRKDNYKKDIPKKIEDWMDNPYLIFTLLKQKGNGEYVVDHNKILEIVDYIYFMSIVYDTFNQLDETLSEEQK